MALHGLAKTKPLLGFLALISLLGLAVRAQGSGSVPIPCAAPSMQGLVLRCDGNGTPVGTRAWLAGKRLDLNVATVLELQRLPKIGPKMAQAIVEERKRKGRFRTLSGLNDVRGIGPKTMARLVPLLRVSPR